MKKKTSWIKTAKKNAWDAFSRYIRLRDALKTTNSTRYATCITCWETKEIITMDAGHFMSRQHSYTFFDEQNVHCQCKSCNMNSWEQYLYWLYIIKTYWKETKDRLLIDRNKTKRFTVEELVEIKHKYQNLVKEIESEHWIPWKR